MLLGFIGNNNTKGIQLDTNTQIINSEFPNSKNNKNIFEDLEKDLQDFIQKSVVEYLGTIRNLHDKELVQIYEEIYNEFYLYLNESSWVFETFSDPPNEVNKDIVNQLSEKINIFKNKVLNLKPKIEKLAEQSRKDAWERVFLSSKNYEKIKKEVGEASSNLTYEDSEKIAGVIDG